MSLRDRLEALVTAAPPDATIPVRWLGELLAAESAPVVKLATPTAGVDLTVAEIATRFGKAPSTVRTWLAQGDLPEAYRLHRREWRIPLAAVEAMQRAQARAHRTAERSVAPDVATDLGAWRTHFPKDRAS